MIYYKITYMSALTGKREQYMRIGFETHEGAQRELDCILRNKEKFKDRYTEFVIANCIENNVYVPSFAIGSDWKIEPFNLIPKS